MSGCCDHDFASDCCAGATSGETTSGDGPKSARGTCDAVSIWTSRNSIVCHLRQSLRQFHRPLLLPVRPDRHQLQSPQVHRLRRQQPAMRIAIASVSGIGSGDDASGASGDDRRTD